MGNINLSEMLKVKSMFLEIQVDHSGQNNEFAYKSTPANLDAHFGFHTISMTHSSER